MLFHKRKQLQPKYLLQFLQTKFLCWISTVLLKLMTGLYWILDSCNVGFSIAATYGYDYGLSYAAPVSYGFDIWGSEVAGV